MAKTLIVSNDEEPDMQIMPETTTPAIARVDIRYNEQHGDWSVRPIWSGVDREDVGGWALSSKRLAERMKTALLAGAVYSRVEKRTDASGKTYAHGTSLVRARAASADLRRLGF